MEFNIESLYNQIEAYAEYIGTENIRNRKGYLIYKIIYMRFDNHLFTFYDKYDLKEQEFKHDRVDIKNYESEVHNETILFTI